MAEMFALPFRPAFDGNGKTIPGAKAYFTLTGTNTPTPVYADEDLDVALANPLVANGMGRFPRAYLDPAVTYRLRVYDRHATVGVDTPLEEYDPYEGADAGTKGDKGDPGSQGEGLPSRAALAAVSATNLDDAFLTEVGRAGKFVFSTADLSAQVAADTAQGIYVQGIGGVWVRQVEGPVNVKWFGAVADGATDSYAAFAAALAVMPLAGAGDLIVPAGDYYISQTVEVSTKVRILGSSSGQAAALTTRINFPANTCGFRFHRHNTSGATNTGGNGIGADGSLMQGISLYSAGGSANILYPGIWARCRMTIRDCGVVNFPGPNIAIRAEQGSGTAQLEGNANCWRIDNVRLQNSSMSGLYVQGADGNAGLATGVDASSNDGWGIEDQSFLGNEYRGIHSEANGSGAWKVHDANAVVEISGYTEPGQPAAVGAAGTVASGPQFAGVTGCPYLRNAGLAGGGLQSSTGFTADLANGGRRVGLGRSGNFLDMAMGGGFPFSWALEDGGSGALLMRLAGLTLSQRWHGNGVSEQVKPGFNDMPAAATLGTVNGKVAIYNADGTVRGYLPIYDAIT